MEGFGLLKQLLNNQELGLGSRVWNLIQDTFLAGAIYKTTTYLFSLENIARFVNYCLHILGLSYNSITIFGNPTKKNPNSEIEKEDFSVKFKAVLYQLKQAGYSNAGVHQVVECDDPDSDFIVSQTTTFTLAPAVFCTIMKEEPKERRWSWDREKPTSFRVEIFSRKKNVEELEDTIVLWIEEYNQYILKKGENMIELIGSKKKGYSEVFEFSNKFLAVLHKMKSLNFDLPSIKLLTEIRLQEPKEKYSRNEEEEEKINAEALIPKVCRIEKDIICIVEWKTDKDQLTEYSIKISSEVLSTNSLADHLDKWEKEYNDFNQIGEGLKYFVFNPSNDEKKQATYTEFSYDSGMSFRNVFFPEKESLIAKIDFFQKNEDWYTARGIPYTLGLLLHGEPGCGKTSAIKAIANMTSRHIISVPLKNVKTASELYSIFFAAKFNTKCLDMNKRLYVLEDIDCGGLKDIVKKRTINTEVDEDNDQDIDGETRMDFKTEIVKLKNRMNDQEQKEQKINNGEITLSDILEVFDGVMETKGRMMVITTNHFNKLDPALIRPGRVDTCIELKRCKPKAILSIFNTFYGEENIPEDFDIKKVPSEAWTPAEIVQIFVNNSSQPNCGLEIICEKQ